MVDSCTYLANVSFNRLADGLCMFSGFLGYHGEVFYLILILCSFNEIDMIITFRYDNCITAFRASVGQLIDYLNH